MRVRNPIPIRRARLEVMPMIDIMFFLLAAFVLVSLTMTKQQTIPLQLPGVATSNAEFEPDNVNLAVDSDGSYYLEKTRVTLPELRGILTEQYRSDPGTPIFISGDEASNYGAMMRLLDTVRQVGFSRVSFNVRPGASDAAGEQPAAGGGIGTP